jgi:hypothetical protein
VDFAWKIALNCYRASHGRAHTEILFVPPSLLEWLQEDGDGPTIGGDATSVLLHDTLTAIAVTWVKT